MARRASDDLDEDVDDEDDSSGAERSSSPPARRPSRSGRRRPGPVRAWDDDPTGPDEEEWGDERPSWRLGGDGRSPVYWRARDSLYFEPLVALAIVILLVVGVSTFTHNWPPVYVVESGSMRHPGNNGVGIIDPGDMVLAEQVPNSSIVPYTVALRDGVRTYGEPGDVIIYHPNGDTKSTPIVHRAILYLVWNPTKMSYSIPDLRGLPCGNQSNKTPGEFYYSTNGSGLPKSGTCSTNGLFGYVQLFNVGWDSITITLHLSDQAFNVQGRHSGYLTMGDNNPYPDQISSGGADTAPSLSAPVEPGWVVGVARGMIPWFGAIKLLLDGNAVNVSSSSWEFLGLSVVALILGAFGIHWALRQEGIESPIRRREEQEAIREREERDEDGRHGFFPALRPWSAEKADDDPPPPVKRSPPPARSSPPPRAASRDVRSGPHRRVRPRSHRKSESESDQDDQL